MITSNIESCYGNNYKCNETQHWNSKKTEIINLKRIARISKRTRKTGRDVHFLEKIVIGFEKYSYRAKWEYITHKFGRLFPDAYCANDDYGIHENSCPSAQFAWT